MLFDKPPPQGGYVTNKLQCGVSIDIHFLAKRTKDECSMSLVKTQGQGLMITKVQGACLVRVGDTSVSLSCKGCIRDKHGNACV
jgi:hypothetical protein